MKAAILGSLICALSACATGSASSKVGFDSELSQYDYPFTTSEFSFRSQGKDLKMVYMDLSPKEKAKGTFVLLHGKNFSGFYFSQLAKDLVEKGYRVVIPDQIGFGKSSKPQGYQYSFAQLARNTQALMDNLKVEQYAVLGHSMGGMLATRMALDHPNHVKQLWLVNPIGLEDYRLYSISKTIDENYATELKANAESIRAYQKEFYYANEWKAEYEQLIIPAVGWSTSRDKDILAFTAAQTSDMIFHQPVVYEFARIKQPTTLVIGLRDRTALGRPFASEHDKKIMGDYPALGKKTAKVIPDSRLIELPGLGHVPFIENYALFSKPFFQALETQK